MDVNEKGFVLYEAATLAAVIGLLIQKGIISQEELDLVREGALSGLDQYLRDRAPTPQPPE